MRTSGGGRGRSREAWHSLPGVGPSAASRASENWKANPRAVNTRARRVRGAESADKNEAPLGGDEGLGVRRRARVALGGCAAAMAAAEWLHGSAAAWGWAGGAAGVAATLLAVSGRPPPGRRRPPGLGAPAAVALACLIVGATLVGGVLQVQRIECCWPEVRAGRLPRDSSALKGTLAAAVAEARRLAERGMTAALLPRQAAFARVGDAVRSGSRTPGVERGVVILAPNGQAVAWAGRHRFVPARDTAELRAVITPFYVSLEARRQTLDGGSAVGTVLLDAVPAAPDRDRAVSAQFEAGYGVALRFYTPGLAPREPDVFDYCPISCERGDTLFSVQPVPPSQGDAKLAALRGATQRGGAALAVALVLLALVAPAGRWRWLVVLAAAWCAARAPLGSSLRTAELFSPAAFYRPALGVFSASAGSLIAAGVVALCAASALWRRGLARRAWAVARPALLVLGAPYLLPYLRRGLAEGGAGGRGRARDPRAVSLLGRRGTAPPAPPPRPPGELYAWWLASPLAIDDSPASLAVWTRAGEPQAEIRLASVDLPSSLVAALVRSPETARGPRVERLPGTPGVHYVLVAPLPGGEVLTVGVGPRTRFIPSARVARFLQGEAAVEAPYDIRLSPPSPPPAAPSARVIWTRMGWSARGERRLELPDGVHHVHLTAALRDPWALLVRGVLVVVVDAGVLAACWIVSLLLAGAWRPRLPPIITALRTSYRVRLAAALSAFVVLPVLLFAVWSFARLGDEARRAGDLLISQTLRDAAATAGSLVSDRPAAVARSIEELGDRLDADLWLFRDGVLAGTSAPVLGGLGLVDPFLAPDAFVRLALRDELELTDDGRTAGRSIRVGYLVGPSESPEVQEILAAPQLLDDERVQQQQEDVALVLIFATLAGLVVAVYLAGLAARGLARPVAALRDAAGAVGRGAPLPSFPPGAPREFEPVISAFERMAADVTRSQGALEEARRRTAQVLANVATGVIALDDGLRVTMANPRAAELLGAPLTPGDLLPRAAPAEWLVVWNAVREFLDGTTAGIVEREFAVGGRQIRVQLASLGPAPDGCVVALDDATAFTRAARVLAGESGALASARRDEVKEVLINLLENARNAGARRVTVRISDGGYGLAVEDDGRGIAADVLPRVFDPAFSTTSSGSGLGLAIARRLVESWGGTIGLTSAPGQGTTVTIRFQASPARSRT